MIAKTRAKPSLHKLRYSGFLPTNPTYQNLKADCGYNLAELASKTWIKCELPEKEKEAIMPGPGMLRT
jgi:hypothetical protein